MVRCCNVGYNCLSLKHLSVEVQINRGHTYLSIYIVSTLHLNLCRLNSRASDQLLCLYRFVVRMK